MFGVHIPEVQLNADELHAALTLAGLGAGDRFVDLGCGQGETLLVAAREFGAVARGVEILPDVARSARERLASEGIDGAIEVADMATVDLAGSDVVLLHLSPAFYDLLADRLHAQLGPTARVVTARWPVPGWHVTGTTLVGDTTFYLHQPVSPHAALSLDRNTDVIERELPAGAGVADSLTIRAHAPLRSIECVIAGAVAGLLTSASGAVDMHRGQVATVELRWNLRDIPVGSQLSGTLTLKGDDHDGSTVTGDPIPVSITAIEA